MNKKRFIAAILAVIMVLTLIPVSALIGSAATDWEYTEREDGTIMLTKFTGTATGDLVVPATVDGKSVYGIDKEVLYAKINLTSITVSEGIEYIGDFCFGACTKVTAVTLPSTLTTLGNCAFYMTGSMVSSLTVELPAACVNYPCDTTSKYYASISKGNKGPFYNFNTKAENVETKKVVCYSNVAKAMLETCSANSNKTFAIERKFLEKDGGALV